MFHLLTCECGREITVTRKQAGQELACECGRTLQVPTLRGFSELPVAAVPASEVAQATSSADQASVWSGWRGPAIAAASVVFLIAGFATARFLYHRSMVDPSYTSVEEIAAGNEFFDKSHPEELSYAWNDYQKLRLGPKDRPLFYRIQKFAEEREYSAMISGAICLSGGLVAGAIWLSARRKKQLPNTGS
jgi:hypothetical protein